MPCCPNCCSSNRVGPHGFQSNHYGRNIINLKMNYYIMSRRYICHECEIENRRIKAGMQHICVRDNCTVLDSNQINLPYTFMGYNMKSLPYLLFGYSLFFPAFLT